MKRYLTEALGTFLLVFAGTGAIIANDVSGGAVTHVGIAITFGLIVMAMIYSIGDISGAHINPAVTIALWVGKLFEGKHVLPYILFQLIGAFAASALLQASFPDHATLGATLPSGTWQQSFIFEVILTFLLMYVVLNVTSGAEEKSITAGVIIGSVVLLEAMFAGPICGASMNPARSIAPAVVSGQTQHAWVYLVATTLGACIAVPVAAFLRSEDEKAESVTD